MPLELVVDSLDKIPETLKAEYTKGDDGKFRLAVNGLPTPEDTAPLKSALARANAEAATRRHALNAWETLGKTPEEIGALLAAQEAEANDKLKKKGNFDELLSQHQKKWGEKETALTGELTEARAFAQNAVRSTGIQGALAKAKATPEGLDLLVERLGQRVQVEIKAGQATTTIMQADGKTPLAGSGKDGVATFDDLVKEAVKQYPSLFEGTGAGGGGKSPKDGAGGAGKTLTRAEYDSMSPYDQAVKVKAGWKVVN